MNEQKALELLDLEPGASASEIRRAYQEIYNELQIRLTNAPTEHQKELYRKRLAAVEDAYIFFGGESEEDLSELPSMGPVEHLPEGKVQASKPQRVSESAALEILGLSKPFSKGRLLDAYKGKKEDFEKGLKVAPNNQIKTAFQKSLDDLENAFSLLETLVSSPPPKVETVKQSSPNKKASPLIWSIPVLIIIIAGIWFFTPKGEEQDEISQELRDEFIKAKSQADILAEKKYWDQALEKYKEAYGLLADTEVIDSIRIIGQRLETIVLDAKAKEQAATESKDWAAAQRANSTAGYLDFIKKHPSGAYTSQAEEKVNMLEKHINSNSNKNHISSTAQKTNTQEPIAEIKKKTRAQIIEEIERNMVFVQGGTFTMGCTSEEQACKDDAKPSHQVTVNDFRIGKFEITQEQWEAIMGTTARQQHEKSGYEFPFDFPEGPRFPMYYVKWSQAQEFIHKLNQITGKNYRLPTEAEWEYAARGGNQSKNFKFSGSNKLNEVGWFAGNSSKAQEVGSKKPNEIGIYDMSGNVREWCRDDMRDYTSSPVHNPEGPDRTGRVLRGGDIVVDEDICSVFFRVRSTPEFYYWYVGFRLAL
ncbi:formylglycine-generating enzyme family protein [Lunatimonas salinarum]|uniref:formylglycine-generating enzyme family protein n=1 Tax=Lunatimonas salinarum TaxID=1774590 RepID=UPI001ADF9556|nr:formylglycine-generating enzyme family protein [Lunatimonas salinarum]